MPCPVCGGTIIGDGVLLPYHCENVEVPADAEPDSGPYVCDPEKDLPRYTVVNARHLRSLEAIVTLKMRDGWKPVGSPIVEPMPPSTEPVYRIQGKALTTDLERHSRHIWYQAMTKEPKVGLCIKHGINPDTYTVQRG